MITNGEVWRLHHGDTEIARFRVTGADFPWMHADVEALPAFEEFRPWFAGQEQAIDDEDYERADALSARIRNTLAMTFPDGRPVPEFMLHVHDDDTAGWRWHDQPFDESR